MNLGDYGMGFFLSFNTPTFEGVHLDPKIGQFGAHKFERKMIDGSVQRKITEIAFRELDLAKEVDFMAKLARGFHNSDAKGIYIVDDPSQLELKGTFVDSDITFLRIFFKPCSELERADCKTKIEIEQFL